VWGARYRLGARYLYIKRNVEKVWGARYLPENTVFYEIFTLHYIYMHFLVIASDKIPNRINDS
jgi:hypothetical protein